MSIAAIDLPSPNHDARPAGVDMLVLHYTGMRSGRDAIDRLRDPAARVSAHYVVEEDGTVFRLVPEERRAWHAGVSFWQGRRGLNDVSVGIEIVNPGHEWGYRRFPDEQMRTVEALSLQIIARHGIPADRVVAHSDIAPDRKQDPGELFDWPALARAGVGLWPDMEAVPAAPAPVDAIQAGLAAFGYDCPHTGQLDAATQVVLTAFQRRFRPARMDGQPDAECLARLGRLLAMRDLLPRPA
ncbi:N-acetylmuramoyl-L-alanine amidase [Constrictibacter sp. MBR-5]|jgi:N-acetylmuramoyl-L-alanine amidase|uniref:N-acetylmuramoyl-L-alanine amidase n=1 Tax=Constrictibacter sp. MBR-5 TaxID=3156467 RepID=UPI0033958843